ncbi:unnamed protein product [Heterotrigona itama]|uniref:Uncharacterized protein n=1 Tax=Heterotrigona itama TaxID=395501 RepID=A0A6V7HER8_9HYME|nr:unnamed protein product [Heterotrigona itama]
MLPDGNGRRKCATDVSSIENSTSSTARKQCHNYRFDTSQIDHT